jgi:hypothetical protein
MRREGERERNDNKKGREKEMRRVGERETEGDIME